MASLTLLRLPPVDAGMNLDTIHLFAERSKFVDFCPFLFTVKLANSCQKRQSLVGIKGHAYCSGPFEPFRVRSLSQSTESL